MNGATGPRTNRCLLLVLLVFGVMLFVQLACAANPLNMTVNGTPKYICPSSTPIPTAVMPPPDPPTYPYSLQANLDYYFVDPSRNSVTLQYLAQSSGTLFVSYSGTNADNTPWAGASLFLGYVPYGVPGFSSAFSIVIPDSVVSALITLQGAGSWTVMRSAVILPGSPNPPPCCLAAPIYPTPRPTYTPYPTPTLFEMDAPQAFYLDDPVYNYVGPVQLKLKMRSPITENSFPVIPLFTAATWTLDITNVGPVEFDFLGGLETYVSQVQMVDGTLKDGVFSPSHLAATFLGITESAYDPQAVQPGQTITVKVAAWIPAASHTTKLNMILDSYYSGDPGYATFTPGSGRLVTWQNQVNTICQGEIRYP